MAHRIITHSGCTDGFSSAFIVKKHFNLFLGTKLTEKQIRNIEVIGVEPYDVQLGNISFRKGDILLDIPLPKKKVFFWCDHHSSTNPFKKLPQNHYWKETPSCAGYLINLAIEKGIKPSKELLQFKRVIDVMDSGKYTKKEIQECFYEQENYDSPSALLKLHMTGGMYRTKDQNLNQEMFKTLFSSKLGETPLTSKELWDLNPLIYHQAQLQGFKQWREGVDKYLRYDSKTGCVIQDDRLAASSRGIADRFYVYTKFPQASYSLNLKVVEEGKVRFGFGSNIFHPERRKVNIGSICKEVGKKFHGTGGGHDGVGGIIVMEDECDQAIDYILKKLST